ncbi:MAG: hypothetical protein PT977_14800 [Acidobacteriota bacterium]|nr:hypothetical protein [Acidobacteriota bacterium]
MLASLLLATVLAVPVNHLSVRQASQPIVLNRGISRPAAVDRVKIFSYCDMRNQPTIMVTNSGPTDLVLGWTLTVIKPGYPTDRWSSVSFVGPGKFEGWMAPATYLHLDIRYDDDGIPVTESADAFCEAPTVQAGGFEE